MVSISIYTGGESLPSSTEVQSAGQAYRLSAKVMKHESEQGGQLQHLATMALPKMRCGIVRQRTDTAPEPA